MSLESVCIIEKDTTGDVLLAWTFPALSAPLQEVILSHSQLQGSVIEIDFVFTKLGETWIYTYTTVAKEDKLPEIAAFCLAITAKDFNPEKYSALSRLLARAYMLSGSPVAVQDGFLRALTTGTCGEFHASQYEQRAAFLAAPLMGLVSTLREHVMRLYTAVMVRKRVILYAPSVDVLLPLVRAVPLLASHRADWNILRPYVTGTAPELEELSRLRVFVAGTVDASMRARTDLWDLFVDTVAGTCEVATAAKTDLAMGSFHSSMAQALMAALEAGASQSQAVRAVAAPTRDLIDRLREWDADGLAAQPLPPAMQRFCTQVAMAEGLFTAPL